MKSKRNGLLDFWKFSFSIIIVLLHSRNLANGDEWTLFQGGYLSVEFFFIVSGIFMAASTLKPDNGLSLGKDTLAFMKRKVGGLMPNFYVAWAIAFLVEHIGDFHIKKVIVHLVKSIWELLLITETGLRGYEANTVTWYLSAMLIAMLIIYPIMKKYKDTFFYVLAPIGFLFIMGVTYHVFKKLGGPHAWFGFGFKAMARAIMGILFGCICFKVGQALSEIRFTTFGRICISCIESGIYFCVIIYMLFSSGSKYDWTVLLLLGIAITLSYSQTGILADLMNHKIFSWLGVYSFSLYLSHGYWSHKMNYLFPNMTYYQRLPIYLAISGLTGLLIMYISKALKILWKHKGDKIISIFIHVDSGM